MNWNPLTWDTPEEARNAALRASGVYQSAERVAKDFNLVSGLLKFQTKNEITWEEIALHFYNYVENKRMGRDSQHFFDKVYAK